MNFIKIKLDHCRTESPRGSCYIISFNKISVYSKEFTYIYVVLVLYNLYEFLIVFTYYYYDYSNLYINNKNCQIYIYIVYWLIVVIINGKNCQVDFEIVYQLFNIMIIMIMSISKIYFLNELNRIVEWDK